MIILLSHKASGVGGGHSLVLHALLLLDHLAAPECLVLGN